MAVTQFINEEWHQMIANVILQMFYKTLKRKYVTKVHSKENAPLKFAQVHNK